LVSLKRLRSCTDQLQSHTSDRHLQRPTGIRCGQGDHSTECAQRQRDTIDHLFHLTDLPSLFSNTIFQHIYTINSSDDISNSGFAKQRELRRTGQAPGEAAFGLVVVLVLYFGNEEPPSTAEKSMRFLSIQRLICVRADCGREPGDVGKRCFGIG
jgi:hypothetical protein